MRNLIKDELNFIYGGSGNDEASPTRLSDDASMQTVFITGTKAQVATARADYERLMLATKTSSATLGFATGAVTRGGCIITFVAVTKSPPPPIVVTGCSTAGSAAGAYVAAKTQAAGERFVKSNY